MITYSLQANSFDSDVVDVFFIELDNLHVNTSVNDVGHVDNVDHVDDTRKIVDDVGDVGDVDDAE